MSFKPIYQPKDIRAALIGGEIQSAIIRDDGSAYLVVTNKTKVGRSTVHRTLVVETSADPEGNGPGFLYVTESDKGAS